MQVAIPLFTLEAPNVDGIPAELQETRSVGIIIKLHELANLSRKIGAKL